MASALTSNAQWKALIMVRALDPAVVTVLWQAIFHHLPEHTNDHPSDCHRKRVSDLLCFCGILIRLVPGSSSETVEALMEYKVSETTLRTRRDEWIGAGVFTKLEAEICAGYDRIIGLDLGFVAIDGSIHKAPCGGQGTGKSPVDRANLVTSGPLRSTRTASRSGSRSTARTATISSCWNRLPTRSSPTA